MSNESNALTDTHINGINSLSPQLKQIFQMHTDRSLTSKQIGEAYGKSSAWGQQRRQEILLSIGASSTGNAADRLFSLVEQYTALGSDNDRYIV